MCFLVQDPPVPMAAFGWSAGDIVDAIKLIVRVARAFKDVGGAEPSTSIGRQATFSAALR